MGPADAKKPEGPERKGLPFEELRETGLLWLINRVVFHPRGYALALHYNASNGDATGWSILGDGSEPWSFPIEDDNDRFAAVLRTFAALDGAK